LQRFVDRFYEEKTLTINVPFEGGLSFDMKFMPERVSAVEMASKLCNENAGKLNIQTEEGLSNCVNVVAPHIHQKIRQWVNSKTIEFNIPVQNNDPIPVSMMPDRDNKEDMARKICLNNVQKLQLTNENIETKCYRPVLQIIQNAIEQWITNQTVDVPIKMGRGGTVPAVDDVIAFLPERQTYQQVAATFCTKHQVALGLTQENWVTTCVNPVIKHVRDYVQQVAQQQQMADGTTSRAM